MCVLIAHSLQKQQGMLNAEQREAVLRVLGTRDYALVLGMPGTGKTTTICHAIINLVARGTQGPSTHCVTQTTSLRHYFNAARALFTGKSVLVSSYTNSALDNILLKLIDMQVNVVRLGRAQAVHPAVADYVPGGGRFPDTTVAGLETMANATPVVAATCLGTNHPLLERRVFDVAIVDEAGQVTVPAVLGPLLKVCEG